MRNSLNKSLSTLLALALALPAAPCAQAQAEPSPSPQVESSSAGFVLKLNSDLVLTNVVVRDTKTGELVNGLQQSDFSIFENGKQQSISTFDFESVDQLPAASEPTVTGTAAKDPNRTPVVATKPEQLRNHRLIVLFFDLSSMQPEDLDRAVDAARDFLRNKMQAADLVALVSLGTSLSVDQDFTADRDALIAEVGAYNGTEGQGFTVSTSGNTVEDASGSTADESEFADLNTDRQLYALRSIAQSLSKINQKKSLLYFSGGISRNGIENQASLRAAINAAVRTNLAIYSVDTRGLQAISPLGDASTGSQRGSGAFTGGTLANNMQSNFSSQELMASLSSDTGGKAFFDSNDFAPAFARVQRDSSAYYALGFRSTNLARDGRYRKLTVKINRPGLKLEYRPGYYAPADFQHSGKEDRERELQEQLASDLPATDMALYLDAFYFRLDEHRFFTPVSLIVPGSQIPFVKGGDKDKATLDIIGQVTDEMKRPIGTARETVKLTLDAAQQAPQKNIQYTTSFSLPPGKYTLKFVVRENQTGRMGSFEAEISLPDLRKAPLKMSSILLASQRQPNKKPSPIVRQGQEYVPNLSHVFRQDQHLYLLFEGYELGTEKTADPANPKKTKESVNLLASLALFQNQQKVFESPLVQARERNVEGRDAVAIELDLPLDKLKPGPYTAQLNIVDDADGAFAFPRFAILIKEPAAATPPATAQPTPAGTTPPTVAKPATPAAPPQK